MKKTKTCLAVRKALASEHYGQKIMEWPGDHFKEGDEETEVIHLWPGNY